MGVVAIAAVHFHCCVMDRVFAVGKDGQIGGSEDQIVYHFLRPRPHHGHTEVRLTPLELIAPSALTP
jgi:hypothetical protein